MLNDCNAVVLTFVPFCSFVVRLSNSQCILFTTKDTKDAHLQQHELAERVVPLHEEDAALRGAAQVLVPVVGVAAHAALGAALAVGHLGAHGELLGHELGGDLVHGVHGDGEAVGLLRVEAQEVVAVQ